VLTILDVINQCLATMALAPITEDEIAGNTYALAAQTKLAQTHQDMLAKGWWFNERLITSTLPDNLMRVEGPAGRVLSWRGNAIYDHTTGATLTAPYPAKTLGYVLVDFPDLPPPLQALIAAATVVSFQSEFDGSDAKLKLLAGELDRALAVAQEIDRASRVNWKRFYELLAYGWWFNTREFTAPVGAPAALPAGTISVQGPANTPLFLEPNTLAVCHTWTATPITEAVDRAVAVLQVPPEAMPAAAMDWLRKASAVDTERDSLRPDPRVLAELNQQMDDAFAALRRENGERMILRSVSRDFQARGWWFNTFPLADCIICPEPEEEDGYTLYGTVQVNIGYDGDLNIGGYGGSTPPFSVDEPVEQDPEDTDLFAWLTGTTGEDTNSMRIGGGAADSVAGNVEPMPGSESRNETGADNARYTLYFPVRPGDLVWVAAATFNTVGALKTATVSIVVGPSATEGVEYTFDGSSESGEGSTGSLTCNGEL
jgi:hypothetical protein